MIDFLYNLALALTCLLFAFVVFARHMMLRAEREAEGEPREP